MYEEDSFDEKYGIIAIPIVMGIGLVVSAFSGSEPIGIRIDYNSKPPYKYEQSICQKKEAKKLEQAAVQESKKDSLETKLCSESECNQ